MPRMSQAEFDAYNMRTVSRVVDAVFEPVEYEGKLHEEILKHCLGKLWYAVHSRTDQKTTTQCGVPDFIIFGEGKVWLIECKAKDGKMRPAQMAASAYLRRNGFVVHIVRNFEEFLEAVK